SLYFDNLRVGTSFSDVLSSVTNAPGITNQPQSQTVTEGGNVTFTVGASGTPPLYYQWQFYGTNLNGATNSSLSLTSVTTNQAGPYALTVTNSLGSTNSQTASLTVIVPPGITSQPQSQTATEGNTVSFSVSATGTLPLSYQWRFYSTNVAGATDSTLTLTSVT